MKPRDLIPIIQPMLKGAAIAVGAVAAAAIIPLMFALAISIAG